MPSVTRWQGWLVSEQTVKIQTGCKAMSAQRNSLMAQAHVD